MADTGVARARRIAFSPEAIILAGCTLAFISFGPRSTIGAFQKDILVDHGWTRDVFSLGIALQNLLWGLGQPFAGALADRYGAVRVLVGGALLYAAGLALMAVSSTPATFNLTAGALIGFGLSGCSFNLVLGAFGKLLPENRRSMAFGLGTAAGSFGQFVFSPLAVGLIQSVGWQTTTVAFGALSLLMVPLAFVLATPTTQRPTGESGSAARQTTMQALVEAFGHRSFMLLTIGFFTCGFQLAFITAHFQIYLLDVGLSAQVGGWAFALIGVFNIVGSLSSGWLGNRMPRRYILSFIYLSRAAATVIFVLTPPTAVSAFAFAIASGLLWLSTVPPTSSLIGIMFGTRHFAMLYGFAFFSHQVGGFLGIWLGGVLFERTGSYDIVWWLSVALGVASALINLPIVERPVARAPASAAA